MGTDYSDLTIEPVQLLVYYSNDGGETWKPSAWPPTGGYNIDGWGLVYTGAMTYVLMKPNFATSGIAYASTWGNETSAFFRTKIGGKSWKQISLIDRHDRLPLLFLHGSAPDLRLDMTEPSGTTAKYKDSPGLNRTTYKEIGTWSTAPMEKTQSLDCWGYLSMWIGLKNSDDQGTYFDVRVQVLKNREVITTGWAFDIEGVTRNPDCATEVVVGLRKHWDVAFDVGDVFSVRVLAKVADKGGHNSAVGLRLYYDSVSRPSFVYAEFHD